MPTYRPPRGTTARGRTRSRTTGMTQSPGWLRPDQIDSAETVVALFRREQLPAGLSALHSRGMGHTARVLDPARGAIGEQFFRAGITVDLGFPEPSPDDVFLLVSATGRSAVVGDLLLDSRAREVRIFQPRRAAEAALSDDLAVPPASADEAEAPAG